MHFCCPTLSKNASIIAIADRKRRLFLITFVVSFWIFVVFLVRVHSYAVTHTSSPNRLLMSLFCCLCTHDCTMDAIVLVHFSVWMNIDLSFLAVFDGRVSIGEFRCFCLLARSRSSCYQYNRNRYVVAVLFFGAEGWVNVISQCTCREPFWIN